MNNTPRYPKFVTRAPTHIDYKLVCVEYDV
jgi:hypothetical protein